TSDKPADARALIEVGATVLQHRASGARAQGSTEVVMAASLAEIEIAGGISRLKCPITGIDVISEEEGFNDQAEHSPHLRFFVDWTAQVWVADPADLPADQAGYQRKIIEILSQHEDQNALIAKCLAVLPKSAVVLEILNPPAPSFDGEICYVCFD